MTEPQDFLQYVVTSIVDHPNDVTIDVKKDAEGTLLTLRVHPEDMGKVVGKKGTNINAIKSLVRAAARDNGRYSVKLFDPAHDGIAETSN